MKLDMKTVLCIKRWTEPLLSLNTVKKLALRAALAGTLISVMKLL